MGRPDVPQPWSPRRADPAPADLVRALSRRYAHGGLLAELLWQRGLGDPDAAMAFLEPSLARGLRPPSADGTLDRFAAAVGAALPCGLEVDVAPGASLAHGLAAAAIRVCLPESVAGARLTVGPSAWTLDGANSSAIPWAPSAAGSGLPGGAGIGAAALYLLARLRRTTPAADARRGLDLLALAVLAESPALSMRDEHRTIVAIGTTVLAQRAGLRALCATADVPEPSAGRVAARLVPRLAAAWKEGGAAALARLVRARGGADAEAAAAAIEVAFARHRAEVASAARSHAGAHGCYDAELPLGALAPGLALTLRRLEPYGDGNPEPLFLARGVRVDGARLAGDPTRPYQRLRLRQDGRTIRAVATGACIVEAAPDERFDVLYTVRATPGGVGTSLVGLRLAEPQVTENPNKTLVS